MLFLKFFDVFFCMRQKTSPTEKMAAKQAEDAKPQPNKSKFYATLHENARRYLKSTRDPTANLANIAALIYHEWRSVYGVNSMNWCGFYLARPVLNTVATSAAAAGSGGAGAAATTKHDPNPDYKHSRILVLGPFHGLPAVTLIPYEKGVCGTGAVQETTQLIPDVHAHPNHIACDSASQSEIVVPVFVSASSGDGKAPTNTTTTTNKKVFYGVLDIDSPVKNGFSDEDRVGMEQLMTIVSEATDLNADAMVCTARC